MTYQEKLRKNAESLLTKAEKVNTEVSGTWTYRNSTGTATVMIKLVK